MMYKQSLFLLILLPFIFASSCKKKCKTVPEVPKDYLDYWYFPTGSWWIYELVDSSGIYDTANVISTNIHITTYDEVKRGDWLEACKKQHSIRIEHTSSKFYCYGSKYSKREITTFASYAIENDKYYLRMWGCSYLFFNAGSLFTFPFVIGDSIPGKLVDTFSVITSLQKFNNVIHIKTPHNSHFYFSKNVGIVKTVYPDSTEWVLIDYQLK